MSIYKKVVLAIDPLINCEDIILKAKKIVTNTGVLEMIYVWDEVLVSLASDKPLESLVDDGAITHSQKSKVQRLMIKIANRYDILAENTRVLTGSAAKENTADYIVIGSPGITLPFGYNCF